ncbi:MAG: glycosyltransferase [archaeon]
MISVFLPAYNEGAVLEKNARALHMELSALGKRFEIFIIDDNSGDNTPEIARRLSGLASISCIRYGKGPTRRENLARSFKKAKGSIIVFMDADLATPLKHLGELISHVSAGADIAIGSRLLGKKPRRQRYRHAISLAYCWLVRKIMRSGIMDHQCGFKAFRRDVLMTLLEEMGTSGSRGYFWDAELLIRAQRRGYRIVEFPVEWASKGSFRPSYHELLMVLYILKNLQRLR